MNDSLSKQIWFYTTGIIIIGLIALFSASYQNVRVPQSIFYNQLSCVALSYVVMFVFSKIDYKKLFDISYPFFILNVILLILVLVSGKDALGARRWLILFGINFQPSELAKLALILALGKYLSQHQLTLSFNFSSRLNIVIRELIIPLFMTLLLMAPVFKQPDLGTSLLFFGIFLAMIFANDISWKIISIFLGFCMAMVPLAWKVLKSYQKDRLLVFLNPNIDPLGAGYTIIQSKIAVGSGLIFGNGWLSGTQNQLNFLPERHTDFIFSVIGEEWGLAGGLILIFFYFQLINLFLKIALQTKDRFGRLIAVGIVSIIGLQVIINIGMVMGLFPIVGLTLPLVSYGRSSFIITAVMIGCILNMSKKRTVY